MIILFWYLITADQMWQKSTSIMEDCYKRLDENIDDDFEDENLAVNNSNALAEKFKGKLTFHQASLNFQKSDSKSNLFQSLGK